MSNRPGRKMARQKTYHTRASHHERQDRQHQVIVIGLVLIVVLGVAIATIAALATAREDDGDFALNGTPLPAFDEAPVDAAVGLKAPLFVTRDLDGNRVVTGGGGGPNDTAKLIGFVAHWCAGCQAELPLVVDWLDDNELPEGVEIVMVSTWEDANRDNWPPSRWFDGVGWPFPVLTDTSDADIAEAYGLTSTPYWVIVDEYNFVLQRVKGGIGGPQLDELVALAASAL